MVFFGFLLVYYLIGVFLGKSYWQKRHGLHRRLADRSGTELAWMFLWPLFLAMESKRAPELCACPDHVMRRAQLHQEEAAYQAALRQERGY